MHWESPSRVHERPFKHWRSRAWLRKLPRRRRERGHKNRPRQRSSLCPKLALTMLACVLALAQVLHFTLRIAAGICVGWGPNKEKANLPRPRIPYHMDLRRLLHPQAGVLLPYRVFSVLQLPMPGPWLEQASDLEESNSTEPTALLGASYRPVYGVGNHDSKSRDLN